MVAPVGQYHWTGTKATLKYPDKILAANGKDIPNMKALEEVIEYTQMGKPIVYDVERAGTRFTIMVPTMRFTWADLLMTFGVFFLASLAYMSIGLIVLFMKSNIKVTWLLFNACILLSLWSITTFDMQSTHFGFIRLYLLANAFIPAAFVHFSLYFPEPNKFAVKYPSVQFIPYLVSLFLIMPTQLFYPHERFEIFYSIAVYYSIIGTIMVLYPIVKAYLWSDSVLARQRAKVIFLGAAIAFPFPVAAYLLQLLFGSFLGLRIQTNFLALPLIFFPASIGYAIVKHNLFDVDVYIKRAVGYAIMTAIIVCAYLILSILLNILVGKYQLAQSRTFPILFTLGVLLVFNPLRNRIQSLVDRLFFRKEYDYQEIVQQISETMRSLLNQDQICQSIMKFALEPMFVDSGSMMILSKDKNEYGCFIQTDERREQMSATDVAVKATLTVESAICDDKVVKETPVAAMIAEAAPENSNLMLSADDPLMRKIAELKKEVTLYDIQEDSLFEADREAYKKAFAGLGATLVVPLIYEDRLTGIISLGKKKSGKFYRREDINLLNTLASQGALAVENSRMIEEIVEKERMRTKILDAFGKYVTPEVRDLILEGKIPLDGETKEVTVLFADLRDFTTMAESTTPKEVVRIINGYFSEMADAIGQNHGLVLQFIGDEIEAVFGAPLPLEDHPTQSIRAALAMQQRLLVVNEKLKLQGYGPLRHGIGIHTGTVVAANIGSEDRLSYALVGDTVNLASRIQSLNKEFGTDLLISATTVNRLADKIAVEKLPATTVKGKRDPVEIYKLIQTP